jgi:hypothetical protein
MNRIEQRNNIKELICPQYLVEPQYIEGCFKERWTVLPNVCHLAKIEFITN